MNDRRIIPDTEQELAILVGVGLPPDKPWQVERSLDELEQLAATAGACVVHREVQMRDRADSATLVGRGKARNLKEFASAFEVSTIVFDSELAPVQSRNLEEITGCKIIDRTELILDIFAQHAHTREGKLQIELAQLTYLLPRLAGRYHALGRLGGGIGTRGPGEQKLEYDRRRIRERITALKHQIERVRKHRDTQRKKRRRDSTALVALVGYTNAGKTSLLNALTDGGGYVADQLFATLDPRSRRLDLPNRQTIVLTDTVGFISRLPHTLVAAFRATLEEVVYADILIHVVDAATPEIDVRISAVRDVLTEIGAGDRPTVTVFNKTDLIDDPDEVRALVKHAQSSAAVSAVRRTGFDSVLALIETALSDLRVELNLRIPQSRQDVVAYVHRSGRVVATDYDADCVLIRAEVDRTAAGKIEEFIE